MNKVVRLVLFPLNALIKHVVAVASVEYHRVKPRRVPWGQSSVPDDFLR